MHSDKRCRGREVQPAVSQGEGSAQTLPSGPSEEPALPTPAARSSGLWSREQTSALSKPPGAWHSVTAAPGH